MKTQFVFLFFLLTSTTLHAQVKTYRQLPELSLSSVFQIEIRQGKTDWKPVFSYSLPVTERVLVTKNEHIAMFGFEPATGSVEIKINSKTGEKYSEKNIELVNKTLKGVRVDFKSGAMLIKVDNAKTQLFVRLKNDPGNPLNIFADPAKDSPIPVNAKVFRFEASDKPYVQSAEYDRFTVPNDVDVVYIEDGALVKGTIHTAKDRKRPLKLMGQGMVIGNGGILHGPANIPYNSVVLTKGVGNSIEGITVMKSRHFSMDIGEKGHIDNVKLFGYAYNNDGFVAGDSSLIENCFLKVNDDHIKLYHDDVIVRNCVFYVQTNGAVFQFAWNRIDPGDRCLVENCEVVACEFENCGDPVQSEGGLAHCFVSLREAQEEGKLLDGCTIRNILIQGQLQRFIGLNGYTYKGVTVNDLKLENIAVENEPKKQSWVYTKDSNPMEVTFKNVIFGKRGINKDDIKIIGDVKLNFETR